MARIVQKFGGTSVGTAEKIQQAADIVATSFQEGHELVVVVSAMSGETDRLIALAQSVADIPSDREYAALIATGEQVSIALMTLALIQRGLSARSYTGGQARILTDSQYRKARIIDIDTQPIETDLRAGCIVVVAGFQGVDADNNITTLGRGGSDTTAVALASALKADECQIFTDVDGVYTTDPRIVPDARRLDQVTFGEMLELSSLGAKVLQLRAVEFAGKYNVPLRVLSASEKGPGTLISYQPAANMEAPLITGIAYTRHEAKIVVSGFSDQTTAVSQLLAELSQLGVNADMILHHVTADDKCTVTFTVHTDEYQLSMRHLQKILPNIGAESCDGVECLAKVSIVGAGLKSHPQIAPIMFQALSAEGIAIQLIASSELKISVVIDNQYTEQAIQALHQAFHLQNSPQDENRCGAMDKTVVFKA
ncbi:MAG: aspartate kinase [Legionellaceae bacterium]|nr:aspartate kinase [Legionellaceae bacterium]